jgi:hypothetical protein
MCHDHMEGLAKTDPAALVARMATLRPSSLTFAAEYLGAHAPAGVAVPALLPLLSHDVPVAREGALTGLYAHRERPDVQAAVRRVAEADVIHELREMAAGMIGEEST